MNIFCIGDCAYDTYINKDITTLGGIATNVAVQLAKSGHKPYLVTVIGKSDYNHISHELATRGVMTDFVMTESGDTTSQKIELQKNAERIFCGYKPGVLGSLLDHIVSDNELQNAIKSADMVYCPNSDYMESTFNRVKELNISGLKVCDISQNHRFFDLGYIQEAINAFDIIFIGGNMQIEKFVAGLNLGTKLVIITKGIEGSVAYYNNNKYEQLIMASPNMVDTTGCGDAFQGSFLATYLITKSIEESLLQATIAGSKTTQYIGSFI